VLTLGLDPTRLLMRPILTLVIEYCRTPVAVQGVQKHLVYVLDMLLEGDVVTTGTASLSSVKIFSGMRACYVAVKLTLIGKLQPTLITLLRYGSFLFYYSSLRRSISGMSAQ
jgi:hypothetical protein